MTERLMAPRGRPGPGAAARPGFNPTDRPAAPRWYQSGERHRHRHRLRHHSTGRQRGGAAGAGASAAAAAAGGLQIPTPPAACRHSQPGAGNGPAVWEPAFPSTRGTSALGDDTPRRPDAIRRPSGALQRPAAHPTTPPSVQRASLL